MLAPSDPGPLKHGHFRFLPVVPGRMEFAAAIRHALLREEPKVVAVELPLSLGASWRRAVRRLPEITVILYPGETEDDLVYVPVEPADPFTEAVRTALEIGAEVAFIEPDLTLRPHFPEPSPDPFVLHTTGYDRYVAMYREAHSKRVSSEMQAHARAMAWKLQGTDPLAPTAVVLSLNLLDSVIGSLNEPQEDPDTGRPRRDIELINPHPDCLAEILIDYPYLQSRYEEYRMLLDDRESIQRHRVQLDVMRHAEETYNTNTGESVVHWQRRLIAKYTRNLARTTGDLTAGIFDMCVAARSIVDDNYGWEVWESANRYA